MYIYIYIYIYTYRMARSGAGRRRSAWGAFRGGTFVMIMIIQTIIHDYNDDTQL